MRLWLYTYDPHYQLQIRFDRDITQNGRISVFSGNKKLYSFTVFAKKGEYDILKSAFHSVNEFLKSDRSIHNLPDNERIKGFFHHY